MMRTNLSLCVGVMSLASSLFAQQAPTPASPSPVPGAPPGAVVLEPSPEPLDLSPHAVTVPGRGPSRDRDSADAGPLKGVQARAIKSGEARLVVGGAERT